MTVSNVTNQTSATGSGAAGQVVPFAFPINASSDLLVYSRVTATEVDTLLTETTDYTVSINDDGSGSITTVTAIETTEQAILVRATPKTQLLNLNDGGEFSASNIMEALDKLTRIAIELTNELALDEGITLGPTVEDMTTYLSDYAISYENAQVFYENEFVTNT